MKALQKKKKSFINNTIQFKIFRMQTCHVKYIHGENLAILQKFCPPKNAI